MLVRLVRVRGDVSDGNGASVRHWETSSWWRTGKAAKGMMDWGGQRKFDSPQSARRLAGCETDVISDLT